MGMIYSFRIDSFVWDKFGEECKKIGLTKSECLRRAIVWVYRNNYYKFSATRITGKATSIVINGTLDDLIKTYAKYKGIYLSDVARLAVLAFLTEDKCKKFVEVY